jgi:hypothetical protein
MDWKVFQTDVLDALNQYKEFFDFFERTGTLSDNSRPDCIARVTRENQKIWIFDAKNKAEIDQEDEERMDKYIQQVKNNPLDVGLDHSELGKHEIEPVFITREKAESEYRVVESKSLHQYLRKNLIYTETNRVIRDIAQMTEKKALTHSQARMLYRSLGEFKDKMDHGRKTLKQTRNHFTGLKLEEPPFEDNLPIDFILKHEERPDVYIDVPYREDVEEERKEVLDSDEVYVSLGGNGEFGVEFNEFEEKLMRKLGIMSWKKVAELYTPKIPTETRFESSKVIIENNDAGFRAEIKSINDTEFRLQASMPERCLKKLKDQKLNARKDYGEISNSKFKHQFKVTEDFKINYGPTETVESYIDTVNSIYHSGINSKLSKKVNVKK